MPRKGNVPKREVLPDPVYGSVVVAKLINSVMLDGKKGVAQKIVYDAFDKVKEMSGEEPLEVFEKAMNNIMPVLEVKARRVGGANYQVPMEVRADRRQTLGLRWLTKYTRARGEKTMQVHLLRRKKIHTRWQKLTKHLHITDGRRLTGRKQKGGVRCLKEVFHWRKPEILVSWRI